MKKDISNIHWYINESIINLSLYKTNIDSYAQKNIDYINKGFKSFDKDDFNNISKSIDNDSIDIIKKGAVMYSISEQTGIFTFTLLKSLVVSYFSIFEHYINLIGSDLGLEKGLKNGKRVKESLSEYMNRIFSTLQGKNIKDIIGEELYKGYLEFYLRRNLYVHEYGIITNRYLESFTKWKLDNGFLKFKENSKDYSVGKKLGINSGYLLTSSLQLDTIGIVLGVLYVNKHGNKNELKALLKLISDYLLNNDDYEPTYCSVYGIISKNIDIKNEFDFELGYLIASKRLSKIFGKIGKETEWDKRTDSIIKKINLNKLNTIQLCIFYGITEEKELIKDIILSDLNKNKNSDLLNSFLNYNFLCDFLYENKDLLLILLSNHGIKLNIRLLNVKNISYLKKIDGYFN